MGWGKVRRTADGLNWEGAALSGEEEMIRDAVHETDDEIMHSAFDEEPEENNGDDDLEQVEGWDGEALSDFEIAHRNVYGDHPNNYDRQVAAHADQELLAQNAELQQQNQQLQQQYHNEFVAPERVAGRRAEQMSKVYDTTGFIVSDEGKATQFLGALDNQFAALQAVHNRHVDTSIELARAEHGSDRVDDALEAYGALDDQMTKDGIQYNENPGRALMNWHRGQRGSRMPSLNAGENYGRGSAPSRGGRGRDMAQEFDGFGHEETEMEIARSVWDD